MAGIYIHIPFCRQKCYYCDFYKTVNTSLMPKFLSALKTEAKNRKNYLHNEPVGTIYFGGGTPSVLSGNEMDDILHFLNNEFDVENGAEITLEANPDDLSPGYLSQIGSAGINRLSIGIQAFQDWHLGQMNRRHSAHQAVTAVEDAVKAGFGNISVDLIYGLPGLTAEEWKNSLQQVFDLPVQHLSAYHLTYHEGTAFYTWLKKGTLKELNETESVEQFDLLVDLAAENGFEQYEISNFARDGIFSRHNTSYWTGAIYLGLGPSAHSFDGDSRRWNVSHVESYIRAIENGKEYSEKEKLSANDRFNEYILTRIRTKWGVSLEFVGQNFGSQRADYLQKQARKYIDRNLIILKDGVMTLSRGGLLVSDDIMADLVII